MPTSLLEKIDWLKANRRKVLEFDEAATKNGIVLPMLELLGWDPWNIDEVKPEFSIQNTRVDYALRLRGSVKVLVEVKKPRVNLTGAQEQFRDYASKGQAGVSVLTNGVIWQLFLPKERGNWAERNFLTLDLLERDGAHIQNLLTQLLSKENVAKGRARQVAREMFRGNERARKIELGLPDAWNDIINRPSNDLVVLMQSVTERISGYRPDEEQVVEFVKNLDFGTVEPERDDIRVGTQHSKPTRRKRIPSGDPTRPELVKELIKVLREFGGKAKKTDVEKKFFAKYRKKFGRELYQEKVSWGIERWRHNLAWAKEKAKTSGFVKRPADSGRGVWELTEKAKRLKKFTPLNNE